MKIEKRIIFEIGDVMDMSQLSGERTIDSSSRKRVSTKHNIKNATRGIVIGVKELQNGATSYTFLTDRFEKVSMNEKEIEADKVLGSVNFSEMFMSD